MEEHLTEEDLVDHLFEEALEESTPGRVGTHIERCAACRQKLDELRRFVDRCRTELRPGDPPDENRRDAIWKRIIDEVSRSDSPGSLNSNGKNGRPSAPRANGI